MFFQNLLNPNNPIGALVWAGIFLFFTMLLIGLVRRATTKIKLRLTDSTGLIYVSGLIQLLICIVGFILYAHLVPELRDLGKALLTGVGIISVIVGFAAQGALANLISGLSLVIYRPFLVGDVLKMTSPLGLSTVKVKGIYLGYTLLVDENNKDIVVPNNVMVTTVVVRESSSLTNHDY